MKNAFVLKPIALLLALGSPLAWSADPAVPVAAGSAPTARTAPNADAATAMATAQTDVEMAASRAEMARLQSELGELSKRMAELSLTMNDRAPRLAALRYLGSPDRAMIGMVMSPSADGVRIAGLTPDGPAARAGLKSGDIITTIDGSALAERDGVPSQDKARELLHELKDGQDVKIGYRRDGKDAIAKVRASRREAANSIRLLADGDRTGDELDRNVEVIVRQARADATRAQLDASRAGADASRAQVEAARAQRRAETDAARAFRDASRAQIEIRRSLGAMPWWGVQLTELNPDLGRYFGTERGVLVLATDGGALDGVKAGDVIQQIAGSTVDRPEEALRYLRDQPADSKIAMQVLRDRKPLTLSVTTPTYQSMFDIAPPPPPPAPPALVAPVPPAPAPPPPAPPMPVAPAKPASAPTPGVASASVPAMVAVAIDAAAPATIATVVAHPALQAGMVSPGTAAKGGTVGTPGLWAGQIRAVESNDDGTCYRVMATTIAKGGKPVRGDVRGPEFSACTSETLDKKDFYAGRYATFLGTVNGPEKARLGRAGRPTLAILDATAWSQIPDMPGPASVGPSPPPQGW